MKVTLLCHFQYETDTFSVTFVSLLRDLGISSIFFCFFRDFFNIFIWPRLGRGRGLGVGGSGWGGAQGRAGEGGEEAHFSGSDPIPTQPRPNPSQPPRPFKLLFREFLNSDPPLKAPFLGSS